MCIYEKPKETKTTSTSRAARAIATNSAKRAARSCARIVHFKSPANAHPTTHTRIHLCIQVVVQGNECARENQPFAERERERGSSCSARDARSTSEIIRGRAFLRVSVHGRAGGISRRMRYPRVNYYKYPGRGERESDSSLSVPSEQAHIYLYACVCVFVLSLQCIRARTGRAVLIA